ncbi:MAG: putative pyridoxal-dependent aspartate 1-decarboxylase [Oligoflexales bacterium]|nr:putative pyridoxal-dependent aspartate 1-decarboxylase [Oligoflexales bacterium]
MENKLCIAKTNLEKLYRVFTVPENDSTTLGRIEKEISGNLLGFLKEHIVASNISSSDLEQDFLDTEILDDPVLVSEQTEFLMDKVVSRSVHTSSPSFVGHMTSALPYFMLPLAKIMIALNQNLVKIETSKAFTPLERQVVGMIHRLVFCNSEEYYRQMTQKSEVSLGTLCSDGTLANVTALWVALNRLFPPCENFKGVGDEGLFQSLKRHGYEGLSIIVSERGHYSLLKAANLLGIGRNNLITIPTDHKNKIRVDLLLKKIEELRSRKVGIVAIVGIAGTTETGNVDPLGDLAAISRRENIHFHVDAAWGGPTLFSSKYRYLLSGIEEADSVTIDAHKQLYIPIGAGIVVFRSESSLGLIEHSAEYIIRKGSRDLGRRTLEGSRPGIAMLIHSGLRIIARPGYELLIDLGIEKARAFAEMIRNQMDFELITEPELNLLTYRYIPEKIRRLLEQGVDRERSLKINELLNRLTISLQKEEREGGKTFVSRTALNISRYHNQLINVFRVVIANPLTKLEHLRDILEEQRSIAVRLVASQFSFDDL